MTKIIAVVFAALVLLYASGCAPIVPLTTGEPLRKDKLETIIPGKTTKQDLFERFGPPTAIARRHEIIAIPASTNHKAGSATSFKGIPIEYRLQSDTFFELFAGRELGEYHRIYYYEYVKSSLTGYIFVIAYYESGETETDRLWLLVNEKTGIVEDFVFKKHNEKAFFGPAP